MSGASATPTITSSLFHSQHPLKQYHYTEESTYPCDACELRVTGTGYSCDECNFDIHAACLSLPASISFAEHTQHRLVLKALGPGASRRCDACGEITSHAWAHVYHCAVCDYDVHPRCTSLVAAEAAQPGGGAERRRGSKRRALKIGVFGLNILTGGIMPPVLDAIVDAI